MKYGLKWMLLAAAGILLSAQRSEAQTYVKLNGLYALVGVINPAVEFRLSPHSTFQSEFVCSPWKSIEHNGAHKPMLFGIFMNEYRRYFKQHNTGCMKYSSHSNIISTKSCRICRLLWCLYCHSYYLVRS